MAFTWGSIQDALTSNNVPEMILAIAGVLALLIAISYVRNKDGGFYKILMLLGVIVGIVLVIISIDTYGQWSWSTSVFAIVLGFALMIRPFKNIQIAILIALFVMALVYLLLGNLEGGSLDVLSTGWPRIIIAVVAGILTFTIAKFAEALVKLFGTALNFWPVLFVLGLICVAEAICVYMGYGSIYEMLKDVLNSTSEMLLAHAV